MSELSREEKAFLDDAYAQRKNSRRTFTEKEALHAALREGYELKLSFDERFARAEGRQGSIPPHWRLAEQTLANTRLLNDLQAGLWDGQNLDEKLQALDQEDQLHYTFYPHDPRLFQNRQGAWEATGERQVTLSPDLKKDLDTFKDALSTRWSAIRTPLTVGQILTLLEELGWTYESLTSVHRHIRAWLLAVEQFQRVGIDYWIPSEQLPPEIQRTRLQVPPIRATMPASQQEAPVPTSSADILSRDPKRPRPREAIFFKGTVTKSQMTWVATLTSAQLLEGFIPIPKAARGVYPPVMPGEENVSVLKGLWYEDGSDLWIWLDRTHHRLYGPDLLDKIGLLAAGSKLSIEWNSDQIILRDAGLDPVVQKEETRLIDLEELKRLRGGIGESYRQSIQSLLLTASEGLTFKEIVDAVSQKQRHEVSRRTIRSILSSGGFIQQEQRWFPASNNQTSAKELQAALLETLVEHEEDTQPPLSHNDYVRTRVKAIHSRLQEITTWLRENKRDEQ